MNSRCISFGIVAVLFTLFTGILLYNQVSRWSNYKSGCGDFLKLTGDAPTLEAASKYLDTAVSYVEGHNLTFGNSAFMFHTPKNDLGIWYSNLKGAQQTARDLIAQIQKDPNSVSQLTRDNALMKIREVVLDQGSSGAVVTQPDNITVYPGQWDYLIGWIVFLGGAIIFWVMAIRAYNS